jgi:hypothetical protein
VQPWHHARRDTTAAPARRDPRNGSLNGLHPNRPVDPAAQCRSICGRQAIDPSFGAPVRCRAELSGERRRTASRRRRAPLPWGGRDLRPPDRACGPAVLGASASLSRNRRRGYPSTRRHVVCESGARWAGVGRARVGAADVATVEFIDVGRRVASMSAAQRSASSTGGRRSCEHTVCRTARGHGPTIRPSGHLGHSDGISLT